MKQKISVRGLLKANGKILFLRRASGNPLYIGQFELPGGKVEFGESPELALRREIGEEIGVEAGAMQILKIVSWMDDAERDTQHIVIAYLTSLDHDDARLALSDEHDKFIWVKLSDIQQEKINTLSRIVLDGEREEQSTGRAQTPTSNYIVDMSSNDSNNKSVIVYTDGGSRGNPGPSASGFVMRTTGGDLLFEGGKYLGVTTNNQAEYHAVKLALEKAKELGAKNVDFRLDSQLVANQLVGIYQVKNRDLWPIYSAVEDLIKEFDKVTFTHVGREYNREADAMVNKILDEHK